MERLTLFVLFFVIAVDAQLDNAYYRENLFWNKGHWRFDWMSHLSDNYRIFDLSLYGTHNAAATSSVVPFVVCQTSTITEQLDNGIRLLDIRVRRVNDVIALHHGPIFLGGYLPEVLTNIVMWMKRHTSEIVFISVSEDDDPMNPTEISTEDLFEQLLKRLVIDQGVRPYQEKIDGNATVGELRNKLVIIGHRNGEQFSKFRLNHCLVNMKWDYEHLNELYTKWEDVKHSLTSANSYEDRCVVTGLTLNNPLTLMHPAFAASGKIFPFNTLMPKLWTGRFVWHTDYSFMPDFPRYNCVFGYCMVYFEGMNRMTTNFIYNDKCKAKRFGFIVGDFPGHDIIEVIHSVNFCKRPPNYTSVIEYLENRVNTTGPISSVDFNTLFGHGDSTARSNIPFSFAPRTKSEMEEEKPPPATPHFNVTLDADAQLKAIYSRDVPSADEVKQEKYPNMDNRQIQLRMATLSNTLGSRIVPHDDLKYKVNVLDGTELERATLHTPQDVPRNTAFDMFNHENRYD